MGVTQELAYSDQCGCVVLALVEPIPDDGGVPAGEQAVPQTWILSILKHILRTKNQDKPFSPQSWSGWPLDLRLHVEERTQGKRVVVAGGAPLKGKMLIGYRLRQGAGALKALFLALSRVQDKYLAADWRLVKGQSADAIRSLVDTDTARYAPFRAVFSLAPTGRLISRWVDGETQGCVLAYGDFAGRRVWRRCTAHPRVRCEALHQNCAARDAEGQGQGA